MFNVQVEVFFIFVRISIEVKICYENKRFSFMKYQNVLLHLFINCRYDWKIFNKNTNMEI